MIESTDPALMDINLQILYIEYASLNQGKHTCIINKIQNHTKFISFYLKQSKQQQPSNGCENQKSNLQILDTM